MNHSPRFWRLVNRHLPRRRSAPRPGSTRTAPICTATACQSRAAMLRDANRVPAWVGLRSSMLRPGSFAMTLLLAMLTGIGPLSVDMYLASLPDIGRLLDAPPAQVQLTISVYLVGFAIGQMFYGAAVGPPRPAAGADRRARHLSAGDARLRAGAVDRDADRGAVRPGARRRRRDRAGARGGARHLRGRPRRRAKCRGWRAIMALAPIVAPLIGGVLQTAFGWRSNFVALFFFGARGGRSWCGCCCRRRCGSARRSRCRLFSILRSYRRFFAQPQLRRPSRHRDLLHSRAVRLDFHRGLRAAGHLRALAARVRLHLRGQFVRAICSAPSIAARFVVRWGIDRTIGHRCSTMTAGGLPW